MQTECLPNTGQTLPDIVTFAALAGTTSALSTSSAAAFPVRIFPTPGEGQDLTENEADCSSRPFAWFANYDPDGCAGKRGSFAYSGTGQSSRDAGRDRVRCGMALHTGCRRWCPAYQGQDFHSCLRRPSPHRTLERQLRDARKTIMGLEDRVQALEERDVAREDRVEKMAEFLNKLRGKQT
jgi:hypothetical protein